MDEKGNMKTAPVDGIGQSLKNKAENINGLLAGFLPEEGGEQATVISSVNYSVNAGGKRLRPILLKTTRPPCGAGGTYAPLLAASAVD